MLAQFSNKSLLSIKFIPKYHLVRFSNFIYLNEKPSSSSLLILNNNNNNLSLLINKRQNSTLANWNEPIANSSIVRHSMDYLLSLHEWANIPWAVEIAMVTIFARAFIAFPLTVLQRKILLRYEALKPEIDLISKNLRKKIRQEARIAGISMFQTQKIFTKTLSKEINRLIVRDNCHPVKATFVALFQIPMWIIMSNCYRNFSRLYPDPNDPNIQLGYQQLSNEGILWFQNLTIPDSTGILPIATCLINLTIIQIHVNERKRNNIQDSTLIKLITNGGRVFSVILVPIALAMPASMPYYWFISSSFGLLQNILLMNPKVKNLLKLELKK